MNDELPKFHETYIPILDVLSSGEVLRLSELRKRVVDKFYSHLSAEVFFSKDKVWRIVNFK